VDERDGDRHSEDREAVLAVHLGRGPRREKEGDPALHASRRSPSSPKRWPGWGGRRSTDRLPTLTRAIFSERPISTTTFEGGRADS